MPNVKSPPQFQEGRGQDCDRFARDLNSMVISSLSRASLGLISFAGALPDQRVASRLLDCHAQIDAISATIRAAAVGGTSDSDSPAFAAYVGYRALVRAILVAAAGRRAR